MESSKQYISRYDYLKAEDAYWYNLINDIVKYVRPTSRDFNYLNPGEQKDRFSDIGVMANVMLASALTSFMIPMNMRWFNYALHDDYLMEDEEVLLYLEQLTDTTFRHLSRPETAFYTQGDEAMMDVTSFGMACELPRWNYRNRCIVFSTFPVTSIVVAEDEFGRIDTCYRELSMTGKAVYQNFGDNTPEEIKKSLEKQPYKTWRFLHVVEPRDLFNPRSLSPKSMRYKSIWISMATKGKPVVKESGFRNFPYIISRFSKMAGELRGRSPATNCIGTIKQINEMERLHTMRQQLELGTPIVYDADGFNGNINMYPWALTPRTDRDAVAQPLFQLPPPTDAQKSLIELKQSVFAAFFVDKLMLQKNNVEMRHVEVIQRVEEGLRMIGPQIARLQSEMIGPKIRATFNMLLEHGEFDHIEKPEILNDYDLGLKIEYTSPAAKAQMGSKATSIERLIATISQIAQFDPNAFDIINNRRLTSELALHYDASRKILNTKEEYDAIQEQKAQQQQLAMASQSGQQFASTIKDIASAKKDMSEAGV